MLKFFRKIRRRLLAKKKFSNYLLYATGEIILVVIGILIALSINNANQKRIIRAKEQVYLEGLQNEFIVSRNKLDTLIKVNRQNYESAKNLLILLNDESLEPEEVQVSRLGYEALAFEIAYNPNNSLLNEMMSSGSLKDISNPELRIYLTSWESMIENIKLQESTLRSQRESIRDMFRTNKGSIRTIFDHTGITSEVLGLPEPDKSFSNIELMKTREFENNILLFILTSISIEQEHYIPLRQKIDEMLQLTDAEIKN